MSCSSLAMRKKNMSEMTTNMTTPKLLPVSAAPGEQEDDERNAESQEPVARQWARDPAPSDVALDVKRAHAPHREKGHPTQTYHSAVAEHRYSIALKKRPRENQTRASALSLS